MGKLGREVIALLASHKSMVCARRWQSEKVQLVSSDLLTSGTGLKRNFMPSRCVTTSLEHSFQCFARYQLLLIMWSRKSGNVARMRRRKNTSRSSQLNSVYLLRCTTQTLSRRSISYRMNLSIGVRLWNSALAEICTRRSRKGE